LFVPFPFPFFFHCIPWRRWSWFLMEGGFLFFLSSFPSCLSVISPASRCQASSLQQTRFFFDVFQKALFFFIVPRRPDRFFFPVIILSVFLARFSLCLPSLNPFPLSRGFFPPAKPRNPHPPSLFSASVFRITGPSPLFALHPPSLPYETSRTPSTPTPLPFLETSQIHRELDTPRPPPKKTFFFKDPLLPKFFSCTKKEFKRKKTTPEAPWTSPPPSFSSPSQKKPSANQAPFNQNRFPLEPFFRPPPPLTLGPHLFPFYQTLVRRKGFWKTRTPFQEFPFFPLAFSSFPPSMF